MVFAVKGAVCYQLIASVLSKPADSCLCIEPRCVVQAPRVGFKPLSCL